MTLSRIQQYELQLQQEITQERIERILEQSPPVLREKIAWIRECFADEWRRSIEWRYQVAVLIRDIYDDVTENRGAVYGAKAIEVIKQSFGWDNGVIYQALHVADAFTPEQIEEITQMRLAGGKPLSYSHVVALSSVEDEGQREKLLKQAVKEGWTTRKLTNVVGESDVPQPDRPEDHRGRPLGKPRDFDAVLDQQASFIKDFCARNDQVWSQEEHSLSAKVEDLTGDQFTQERATRLKQHADQLTLLAQKAKERADEALRVHKLFVQVLQQQAGKLKKLGRSAPVDDATER
jgi:hypothetical protein